MLNKVMQELVAAQKKILASQGKRFVASDDEIATDLTDYFGRCRFCKGSLGFDVAMTIATCDSRWQFLDIYSKHLGEHYDNQAACKSLNEAWKRATPGGQKYVDSEMNRRKKGE